MECAGNLLLDYPVPDAEDTGGLCLAVQWEWEYTGYGSQRIEEEAAPLHHLHPPRGANPTPRAAGPQTWCPGAAKGRSLEGEAERV